MDTDHPAVIERIQGLHLKDTPPLPGGRDRSVEFVEDQMQGWKSGSFHLPETEIIHTCLRGLKTRNIPFSLSYRWLHERAGFY